MNKKTGIDLIDKPQFFEGGVSLLPGGKEKNNKQEFIRKLEIITALTERYGIKELDQLGWMTLCFKLMEDYLPAFQKIKKSGRKKDDQLNDLMQAACYCFCLKNDFTRSETIDYFRDNGLMKPEISYAAIKKIKSRIIRDELVQRLIELETKRENITTDEFLARFWMERDIT